MPNQLRGGSLRRRGGARRVEGCDDGNQVDHDACSNNCVAATCQDGCRTKARRRSTAVVRVTLVVPASLEGPYELRQDRRDRSVSGAMHQRLRRRHVGGCRR